MNTMKDKKELLKQIMISLANNETEQAEKLLRVFMDYVPEITAEEVTEVAQKLEDEKVFSNAEQHVFIEQKVFEIIREKIPQKDLSSFTKGHPIHTFLEENKFIKDLHIRAQKLNETQNSFIDLYSDWTLIAKEFSNLNIHYLRKENQLFPYLEQKGFNHPSSIMWSLHDEIRKLSKEFTQSVNEKDEETAKKCLSNLLQEAYEMTIKEERVLLPTSARLLTNHDWIDIRNGEDEIGWIIPEPPKTWDSQSDTEINHHETTTDSQKKTVNPIPFIGNSKKEHSQIGGINLEVGSITPEQINLIFKYLPFDVTYVDENDEVRYYNKGEDRVFPRSPGIIGRQVKYCHPPKSVHIVEKIVDAFKRGEKSEANFWINFQDKFVYIQYFAVRDDNGNYKGVLEITYDAKTVRGLEGERRLLDW